MSSRHVHQPRNDRGVLIGGTRVFFDRTVRRTRDGLTRRELPRRPEPDDVADRPPRVGRRPVLCSWRMPCGAGAAGRLRAVTTNTTSARRTAVRQRKEDTSPAPATRRRTSPRSPWPRQLLTWIYYAMRGGQVRADGAAGHELIGPHRREVAGPGQAVQDGTRLGDGLGERLGQHCGHVGRRLALHHGVAYAYTTGPVSERGLMKKLVRSRCARASMAYGARRRLGY
jgi:hypothetical protein